MDETKQVEFDRVAEFRDRVAALPDDLSFSDWLRAMEELQQVAYGAYYDNFDPDYKADSMMMNLLAAHSEITEMGDEMGWKPWVDNRGWVNKENVIKEAVDAMHFLANLLKHAGCTGAQLTAAYKAKMLKNLDRQLEGYDGVSGKCAHCHRDLGEVDPLARTTFRGVNFCSMVCGRDYEF